MAQFRAIIDSVRGSVSRLGHKSTGIRATCDGWNAGATVDAIHTSDGRDVFTVHATGGSNRHGSAMPVCRVLDVDGSRVIEYWLDGWGWVLVSDIVSAYDQTPVGRPVGATPDR